MPVDVRVLGVALLLLMVAEPSAAVCQRKLAVAATGVWGSGIRQTEELLLDRQWLEAVASEAGFCLQQEQRETLINRRLAMLESGEIDLLVGASRTPDRERVGWFSTPYRVEQVLLFVRSDELRHYRHLQRFDQLLAMPLPWLAVRDSWLGPDYAAARAELLRTERVFEFDTFPQGLAMLRFGRGELLLAPDTFLRFLLRENVHDVAMLPTPLHSEPVHFMLSRASISQAEFDRFDAAVRQINARGGPPVVADQSR